jgi:phosphatidylethanolamine-binding protein (PEBP) family uncharacterized protein
MMGNRLCFKSGSTANTGQRSPMLSWMNPPAGTMSFVVSLHDNTNGGTHWIACNIAPTAMGLPANITVQGLSGGQQSSTWYGPGAPMVDQYSYRVWAMKTNATMCNNLAQQARNNLWAMLNADAMGAHANVIEFKEIIAYGNADAACQ